MEADILLLSAGFGTRLRPLTNEVPKPLIKIGGKTLLEWNLELLANSGAKRVIINLHYRGDQIRSFIGDGSRWGLEILYSQEDILLDTGGAVKHIEPLLTHSHLITFNSDILIGRDFNLCHLLAVHIKDSRNPVMTLTLREDSQHAQYGSIGVDQELRVVSFLGDFFGESSVQRSLMYAGISIMSRKVLQMMPPDGTIFSLTKDTMKQLLSERFLLTAYIYDGFWSDIGTIDRLGAASKRLNSGDF